MRTAFLDTCALWPHLQRDFLLALAAEDAYLPLWSDSVLGELRRNEVSKFVGRGLSTDEADRRASRLIGEMRRWFPLAIVSGWEHLAGTFGLPDSTDEHVVAAAWIAKAQMIVTHNLRDFPPNKVPPAIVVLEPSTFVSDIVANDLDAARRAVRQIADRTGRFGPKLTEAKVAGLLEERYGFVSVARLLG